MSDTGNARDGSPDDHTGWEVERRLSNIVQEHITVGKMRFHRRMEVSKTNTYEGTCMIM